jgi:hypothetical protein
MQGFRGVNAYKRGCVDGYTRRSVDALMGRSVEGLMGRRTFRCHSGLDPESRVSEHPLTIFIIRSGFRIESGMTKQKVVILMKHVLECMNTGTGIQSNGHEAKDE